MHLSNAEWKAMSAMWQKHPASARDVLDALAAETSWAYTTVKTILARLVDKGALKMRMRANTSFNEPLLSRDDAQRSALRALLDRAFEGSFGPMVHFLARDEKLSKKERQELIRMLRVKNPKGGHS